jgi:hypothetical protein
MSENKPSKSSELSISTPKEGIISSSEAEELYLGFREHLMQDLSVRDAIIHNFWAGISDTQLYYQASDHRIWLSQWDKRHYGLDRGLQLRLHPLSEPDTDHMFWNLSMGIVIPSKEKIRPWFHYFDKNDERFEQIPGIDTNPLTAKRGIERIYQLLAGKPFPKVSK